MTLVRRLAVVVVAALALCAAAAAAAGDPQFQPAAADQAWTDSIVLNATDVGAEWKRQGAPGAIAGTDTGASGNCSLPDMSDLVLTGGSYSADFYRNDGAYVAATAVSWQTTEQAEADWSRSLQPALMGCLAGDLQAESTKQVKIVVTGRHQLAWPTFGDRSVVYRLSLVLKARVKVRKKWRTVSAKGTADFLAVGAGRARAMLWTFSFDAHPLTDFSQQRWALLMAQRMANPPAG
ncbi:MAG: hypothetical protein ACJ74M_07290 [Gaiellaceae bacterium]